VLEFLARLLPLMLAAAANPVVITLVVLVLTAPDRPLLRATAFLLGFGSILVAGGIVGLSVFHGARQTFGPGGTLYAWVDIGFGALMLGAALLAFTRRSSGDATTRLVGRLGPLEFAGVGALMMATNTSAIAAYVPLLHEISNSGLDRADRATALVISDLVILAPIAAPIAIRWLAPQRADRALGAIRRFLDRYGSAIAAVVFTALGALLVIRGIHRL
jgi:hypothetical protein